MQADIEMSYTKLLTLSTLTVTLNALIGHFFAPNGILMTPVILTITTFLTCLRTKNIEIIPVSVLTYFFVALNDILIKLYSGGTHDSEGLGWIQFFLLIGLVPTFGILMTACFRRKNEKLPNRIIAPILFAGLITAHLLLFSSLGLGRHYWYPWNG